MSKLWINGTLVDKSEARVSPFDHGFLYGEGVWEPLRVFNGKLFSAKEHLQNLFNSADQLHIKIPYSPADFISAIEITLKANDRVDGYIRLIVTRGLGTLGPDPRKVDPQVIIIAEEYHAFPIELYGHGLHAVVFPTPVDTTNPAFLARALGQPHIPLAKHFALQNGCLEAILYNQAGEVIGTTEGALFIVRNGVVVLARTQRPDVMASRVAALAIVMGLTVSEGIVRMADLIVADEVFEAGTSGGVLGIVRIDGKTIGGGTEGSVTRTIREAYKAFTYQASDGLRSK